MNESKDRAALRKIALLGVHPSSGWVAEIVNTALAQPDPVQALVEALRRCVDLMAPYADEEDAAFEDGSMGAALISARAALKAATGE